MLIYVESKAFPFKTFVVLVKPSDKIARIRAGLLHILYDIGREDLQFKLRYKGQYLRDAFFIEDYDIPANAVVKLIPITKRNDSMLDIRSVASTMTVSVDAGASSGQVDVKSALFKEIEGFINREKMLRNFEPLVYMHFLLTCMTLLTNCPYSVAWTAVLFLGMAIFRPYYNRCGGFTGNYTHWRFLFCILFVAGCLGALGASLYLSSVTWMTVVDHGCKDWTFVDGCSHKNVFTAFFFTIHALIMLMSAILGTLLFFNFRLEKGDYIEKFLVQERDIELVMKSARSSRLKEKRTAAYELACMAASGDDNKFRIVAEGGLDVLIAMAHCEDESTQEHAVEAIGELLTIQSIQDNFVDMNGVQTLTSLLHSENSRIMQEAAVSIYTIVSESEENKSAVVADHGLDDLAHAAYQGTIYCQRTIASIYLELAFTAEIRSQMASRNTPAHALVHLCSSTDPDTQRYALQTFELLAIESSEMVCAQEDLMEILLDLPNKSLDEKLYLLAGKILLYYAENKMTCEMLVNHPGIKEALTMFSRTQDPILQKVIAKIIFCMLETKEMKMKARDQQLQRVLEYIRDNSVDRDAWDMADQGIQAIESDEDNLSTLPILSTLEKINKMDDKQRFGSRTSLGSDEKPGPSNSSSSSEEKHRM